MQIVIDIPEDIYVEACVEAKREVHPHQDYRWVRILRSICDGTPLPKGHGALKDADKLAVAIAMIRDRCNDYGNEYEQALFQAYDNSVDEIIDAPTIIEADEEVDE